MEKYDDSGTRKKFNFSKAPASTYSRGSSLKKFTFIRPLITFFFRRLLLAPVQKPGLHSEI